jgi:hypothetical protein
LTFIQCATGLGATRRSASSRTCASVARRVAASLLRDLTALILKRAVVEPHICQADNRHRDKSGNTSIRTLRKNLWSKLRGGCGNKRKPGDVLYKLDEPSLSRLVVDHEAGNLDVICRERLGG